MAKKKKGSKKKGGRRVGSLPAGGGIMGLVAAVVGVGAGIIGGRMLNNMVNPSTATTPSISPTILGAGEAAVGAVVAAKVNKPGMMNLFIKGAALGVGGNGVMYALSSKGLGLLPATIGYGPDPMHRALNRATMQGFRDVPKIGGPARFPAPGAIGSPMHDRAARIRRAYAGVYGG